MTRFATGTPVRGGRNSAMPRIVRRPPRARLWPSLVAGAALGAIGVWLVLRSLPDEGASDRGARPRAAGREPDLDAMSARLGRVAGAEGLRLQSLGGGILELVGSAGSEFDLSALLTVLATEPGVSVVVNRVWTPGSGDLPADLEGPAHRAGPLDPSAPPPS